MHSKKKIAVFGGSFNPPLNSHFSLAEQIISLYPDIEKILFLPVSAKYNKTGIISNEDRFMMLKLVCDKNKNFALSDLEMQYQTQLPTYTTLHLLEKEYPDNELCFIMGADNLKELSTWDDADALLTEYTFLVLERGEESIHTIIEKDGFLTKHKNHLIGLHHLIKSNLSSTLVRQRIKENQSVRYLMPDEVYRYVQEHHLYQ